MANPVYVTAHDVYFNNKPVNTAMIYNDTTKNLFYHVLWDQMDAIQQQSLVQAVAAAGGTVPLAAPMAGYASITFGDNNNVPATPVPAASTSAPPFIGAATAGYATITTAANTTGTTPITLPTGGSTAGVQKLTFVGGTNANTPTGFSAFTSGYQTISFSGPVVGTTATGLANDTTTYNTSITIDGSAKAITVTGSTAQTFADLATQLTTSLAGAGTVTVANNTLVITSATTGVTSSVLTTQGTLFIPASIPLFAQINAAVTGTGSTVPVSISLKINGGATQTVTALQSSLLTYGDLVTAINAVISSTGTAAFTGSDISIVSATTGSTSTVEITAVDLATLSAYAGLQQPVSGESKDYKYNATIVIDRNTYATVSVMSSDITDFSDLVTKIGQAVVGVATVVMTDNVIKITSATTGSSSDVRVYDSGLFRAVFAQTGQTATGTQFASVGGTAVSSPSFTVTVDGAPHAVALSGATVATYADVVTAINTAIGTAGTAAMTGATITITSATTGTSSTVKITDTSLNSTYQRLGTNVSFSGSVIGADTMVDVLKNIPVGGGSLYDTMSIKVIGTKPPKPLTTIKDTREVYYNGTEWVYLFDDTAV